MAINIYHKVICEVYVKGEIKNISKSINDFIKVSEHLLDLGIDAFYFYSSKDEFRLFKEIISLYKSSYPDLVVSNRCGKAELCRKPNYIMLFNWGDNIILYDSKYNKIELEYNDNNCAVNFSNSEVIDFNDDLIKVDLMD